MRFPKNSYDISASLLGEFLGKKIDFTFALCYYITNGLERTRTQRLFVYGTFLFSDRI